LVAGITPTTQFDAEVAKCSVSASFNMTKSHGAAVLSCKGDDLSGLMPAPVIANLAAVLSGLRHVEFKVDSMGKHWSLSYQCAGPRVVS
jgi:hypothetical protein